MKITIIDTVPTEITSSIQYAKIKQALHSHIVRFCREKKDLKDDLNLLRYGVGREYDYDAILEVMESLKEKYNDRDNNVGLDYHIEFTRYDYALIVNVIIKRDTIEMKKFVYRYKKKGIGDSMINVKLDKNKLKSASADGITQEIPTVITNEQFSEDSVNSDYEIIKRRVKRRSKK